MKITIMEKQMEKNTENDVEASVMYLVPPSTLYWPFNTHNGGPQTPI